MEGARDDIRRFASTPRRDDLRQRVAPVDLDAREAAREPR